MISDFEKTLEAKSDQINASDLVGREMVITIKSIKVNSKQDQPVSISINEDTKVYRPSKGMRRLIADCWGTTDYSKYIGRQIKLFRDPEVKYGGKDVGGIAICELSDMKSSKDVVIPIARNRYKTYTVRPLKIGLVDAKEDKTEPVDSINEDEVRADARDAARQGKDAFRDWWKSASPAQRQIANEIMDELKSMTEAAE